MNRKMLTLDRQEFVTVSKACYVLEKMKLNEPETLKLDRQGFVTAGKACQAIF